MQQIWPRAHPTTKFQQMKTMCIFEFSPPQKHAFTLHMHSTHIQQIGDRSQQLCKCTFSRNSLVECVSRALGCLCVNRKTFVGLKFSQIFLVVSVLQHYHKTSNFCRLAVGLFGRRRTQEQKPNELNGYRFGVYSKRLLEVVWVEEVLGGRVGKKACVQENSQTDIIF